MRLQVLLFGALSLAIPMQAQNTYTIDSGHSEVSFKIKHFLSKIPGLFTRFSGVIVFDLQDTSKSKVHVNIASDSINTDDIKRDEHLKSPDFFDVRKFPSLSFESISVLKKDGTHFQVAGDLTMHGVTRRVSFPFTYQGEIKSLFGDFRAGFGEMAFTVNRKDFGIVWNRALDSGGLALGEDVEISLNIEAIRVNKI